MQESQETRCRAEHAAFQLEAIASMHWANHVVGQGKMYVYLNCGRFVALEGVPARALWEAYTAPAVDVVADFVALNA